MLAAAGYDTGVAPPSQDLLAQYGVYIAVVIVVVVVVIVAVYALRKRK